MVTIRETGFADRSPMANEIHMRTIDLRRWDERFEHGMRTLGRAANWEQA
jgi:hypothetical protein